MKKRLIPLLLALVLVLSLLPQNALPVRASEAKGQDLDLSESAFPAGIQARAEAEALDEPAEPAEPETAGELPPVLKYARHTYALADSIEPGDEIIFVWPGNGEIPPQAAEKFYITSITTPVIPNRGVSWVLWRHDVSIEGNCITTSDAQIFTVGAGTAPGNYTFQISDTHGLELINSDFGYLIGSANNESGTVPTSNTEPRESLNWKVTFANGLANVQYDYPDGSGYGEYLYFHVSTAYNPYGTFGTSKTATPNIAIYKRNDMDLVDVYFVDQDDNADAFCYAFGEGTENHAFPGVPLTPLGVDENGDNYYKITVDRNTYTNVIFSGGGSDTQTANLGLGDGAYIVYYVNNHTGYEGEDVWPGPGTEVAPTCTDRGYIRYTGLLTGVKHTTYTAPALGHDWELVSHNLDDTHTYICTRDNSHSNSELCADADVDGVCDVCGGPILTRALFVPADSISPGDEIIFVYPGDDTVPPAAAGDPYVYYGFELSDTSGWPVVVLFGDDCYTGEDYLRNTGIVFYGEAAAARKALVLTVEEGTQPGTYAFQNDGDYLYAETSTRSEENGLMVDRAHSFANNRYDWELSIENGLANISYCACPANRGICFIERAFSAAAVVEAGKPIAIYKKQDISHTVRFSVPEGVEQPADMICHSNVGITLPTVEAPAGYVFRGWVVGDYNYAETRPEWILTGNYVAPCDVTLKALFATDDGVFGTHEYELVTEAPEDWTGKYLITHGTDNSLIAMTGLDHAETYQSWNSGLSAYTDTGMNLNGTTLTNENDLYAFEIRPDRFGGYTIQSASTKHRLINSLSGLFASDRYNSRGYQWDLSLDDDGNAVVQNHFGGYKPVLTYWEYAQYGKEFLTYKWKRESISLWKNSDTDASFYTTVIDPSFHLPPIETPNLRVVSNISVSTDMTVVFAARKTDVTNYERFWIEVVKHAPEGDVTYTYGDGQEAALYEGGSSWQVEFKHISAKEMGVEVEARLYVQDASGQIYMSPAKSTNIRDYLGGRLTATNNTVEQRVLAADMLNYGAAAQLFTNYDVEHLVNEELTAEQLAKLDEYETKDLPLVEKTNSNYRPAGQSNILFNSVSLDNEVVLTLLVRAAEGNDVKVLMKDHESGTVLETLDAAWNGSNYVVDYSGIGADKMRVAYDFTAQINSAETGNIRTWSVEGYVGELRNGSNQLQIAVANALLAYGDSAAAYFAAQ